jgi:deleted-in-malignant-brain-tumors protein 1
MGEWRSVCDDGFDMSDANVACRMLGYSAAESFTTSVSGTNDNFWLDDLACTGSESSFTECTHSGWGVENCSATESVQVVCVF